MDMKISSSAPIARWRKATARILSLFAQPVRKAPSRGGIAVQANRGYGSREEIFCIGRVFQQSRALVRRADPHSILDQLRDVRRRIFRRSLSDVVVKAQFYGTEERFTTDRDGYFRINLRPRLVPPADMLWHTVAISIEEPKSRPNGS